jgi:ATP-binding cassette subfamily B protein
VKQMIDHGFTSGGQINRAFALLMLVAVVLALATAARFFFVSLLGEKSWPTCAAACTHT